MTEPQEVEQEQPNVTDVPEPDQEPHEPVPDEADTGSEINEDDAGVEGDTEPGADPTDPATAPVGARDDADVEKAFKSLAKEATRHANRVGEIMGEDAQLLQPCPRCVTTDPQRPAVPGFIFPAEVVPLLPEDKARVKLSIGEGAEPEFLESDDAYACTKCGGMGKYKTGSKVRNQDLIVCDTCEGRGWNGQRAFNVPAHTTNGEVTPVLAAVGADEAPSGADPWGRLPDDPNYGVLPGYTH